MKEKNWKETFKDTVKSCDAKHTMNWVNLKLRWSNTYWAKKLKNRKEV